MATPWARYLSAIRDKDLPSRSSLIYSSSVGTSQQIIAPKNLDRVGIYIWNDGGSILFVSLGFTPTSSLFTFRLSPNSGEFISRPVFTGNIHAIRSSGSGNVLVTELYI